MECEILQALVLPWWKLIVYLGALVLSIVAVRVVITFDLNSWLETRAEAKRLAERKELVKTCGHAWTLYPNGPYSRCAQCQVLIETSILVAARDIGEIKPVILAQHPGVSFIPGKGDLIVDSGALRDVSGR